jgi:hypothetical protein
MKEKLTIVLSCAFLLILAGCAVSHTTLDKKTENLDLSDKSVAIFVVDITSKLSSIKPFIEHLTVFPDDKGKSDMIWLKRESRFCNDGVVRHLISIPASSRQYIIEGMAGAAMGCAEFNSYEVHRGSFYFDMKYTFNGSSGKVVYLGHIYADLRERKSDNEPRAGGFIPILEQTLIGFWKGTFDLRVEDNYEEDLPMFITKYPVLDKYEVIKSIMSPVRDQQI